MFVFSVKSAKLKFAALVALILIAALTVIVIGSKDTPASGNDAVNYSAKNAEERLTFLSQFGWEVSDDPVEVTEVIIPAEFNEVYLDYNEIQKEQSLDLEPYANTRVKRWTYVIKNYPGYEDSNVVHANLLVYEGRVIGGDISSIELNGFMNGFIPEEK